MIKNLNEHEKYIKNSNHIVKIGNKTPKCFFSQNQKVIWVIHIWYNIKSMQGVQYQEGNYSDAYHKVRDKQKRRKYLECLTWG